MVAAEERKIDARKKASKEAELSKGKGKGKPQRPDAAESEAQNPADSK